MRKRRTFTLEFKLAAGIGASPCRDPGSTTGQAFDLH